MPKKSKKKIAQVVSTRTVSARVIEPGIIHVVYENEMDDGEMVVGGSDYQVAAGQEEAGWEALRVTLPEGSDVVLEGL